MTNISNKRILSFVIALMLLTAAIIPFAALSSFATVTPFGDVNGDGEANELDASYVLRYVVELTTLSEEQLIRGDVNRDGETDAVDASLILKHGVGSYTIEQEHVHTRGEFLGRVLNANCEEESSFLWKCGICGEEWKQGTGIYHQWGELENIFYETDMDWTNDDANLQAYRECRRCGYVEVDPYPLFTDEEIEAIRAEFLSLLNEERAKNGLKQLDTGTVESEMAQLRAAEVCEKYSHERPNGERAASVLPEFGFPKSDFCGETIAYVPVVTIEEVAAKTFECFMNSPPHKEILLSSSSNSIAIGCFGYFKEHELGVINRMKAHIAVIMLR